MIGNNYLCFRFSYRLFIRSHICHSIHIFNIDISSPDTINRTDTNGSIINIQPIWKMFQIGICSVYRSCIELRCSFFCPVTQIGKHFQHSISQTSLHRQIIRQWMVSLRQCLLSIYFLVKDRIYILLITYRLIQKLLSELKVFAPYQCQCKERKTAHILFIVFHCQHY